jgi:RNA polymerase sigma-70 factor (ECF subfamily)
MSALITGSIDSAKDIVQETFIKVFNKSLKHYDGNFKTYITTISYRLSLKERYRTDKTLNSDKYDYPDNFCEPIDKYIQDEKQRIIFETIHSLKESHREILVLRFYGDHSYEEISQITQIPIGTVKSRIFYAVKECGNILTKKGIIE